MTRPLLIGGATTSRVHTALRIAPAYSGPVVHVLDASRAVGVASTLMSDTQRDGFVKTTADEYQTIRDQRANKGESALLSLADARAHAYPTDFETHPPVDPSPPGVHVFKAWPIQDLVDYNHWAQIGRAPWRESVWKYGCCSVGAVY